MALLSYHLYVMPDSPLPKTSYPHVWHIKVNWSSHGAECVQQSSGPLSSVGTYPLGSGVGAAVVGDIVPEVASNNVQGLGYGHCSLFPGTTGGQSPPY